MEKAARRRGMPTVTNHNTPRSIRIRIAAPRRRAEPSGSGEAMMPLPDSPTQQMARSPSGKTALGPWLGGFGGIGEGTLGQGEPASPTLFATSQGAVFADLEGTPVASRDMGADAEAAVAAAAPAPEVARMMMLAARADCGVLRRKAEAGRRQRGGGAGMGPRPNARMRRTRMIGQARKMN